MSNGELDQRKKEYTDDFLTRQGRAILLNIHMEPGIYSSRLAAKMNIRKNSMSNALERLKRSTYALIRFEQQGRRKRYFLTEWGEAYTVSCLCTPEMMEKCLGGREACVTAAVKSEAEDMQKLAEECVWDLKKSSPEWEFALHDFLKDETECSDEEVMRLIRELMRAFQELFAIENQEAFQKTLELIDSQTVKKQIQGWLERRCGLAPLWDWVEESWQDVYQFIDELFDEHKFVLAYGFAMSYKKYELSETIFRQIVLSLMRLVDMAKKQGLGKTEFYEQLLEQYPQCDQRLGFYIAEKYKELENNMVN